MPKKRPITSDEPLISRPQRNMKVKKVYDPSDNYLPKKRNKYTMKSDKNTGNIIKKSDKRRNYDTQPKSTSANDLPGHSSNELIGLSGSHSLTNSPVKHAINIPEIPQEVTPSICFICSKITVKKELVDCPICMVKAHRECIVVNEPMWKFKLDKCPWFCKSCRKKYCSKCLKDESKLEINCRCITCKIGLHTKCYEEYDIKPLHTLNPGVYVCIPCMTLATERVPEEEDDDEEPRNQTHNVSISLITSEEEDEDDDLRSNTSDDSSVDSQGCVKKHKNQVRQIPNTQKWNKYEVYDYLVGYLPSEVASKIIEFEIDGNALQLLQRTDVTTHMRLKLGHALKLYKQIRILQAQSLYPSVFWE